MRVGLWDYVGDVRPDIERALARHLPCAPARFGERFNEALRYSLFPGGKRLRPVLTLLGAELVGGEGRDMLRAAVAVEYVHTCSLIFDDLPCMDDADERRGRAALHRRYGEATAVLVALALLNSSYGLVFEGVEGNQASAIRAHDELVACIGTKGMVTGQTLDLSDGAVRGAFETTSRDDFDTPSRDRFAAARADSFDARRVDGFDTMRGDGFDTVRNLKTSALMRLSLRLGAILSGANERQLSALSRFAELLGQAYQISDDLLDLAEDSVLAVGGARCATLAVERGAPSARLRVASLLSHAKNVLHAEFGDRPPARLLCQMADYIAQR
jgi:geranylgeranyl diphosphate synthase type II